MVMLLREIEEFVSSPNALRSVFILLLSMLFAYWLSHFVAKLIIKVARLIAARADHASTVNKSLRLRRLETYLSVTIALVRAVIVGTVAFYVWQVLSPTASFSTAAIGASAFFVVIAGATVGMILRDLTAGATMIIERWFDVGDYIRIEPFADVGGVVERITLRSTKLRNMNGEVIWMHNQYIQGVRVTPNGSRTLAIDIYVNNEKVGQNLIEKAIATMPVGPLTVIKKMQIIRKEQWGDHLWLFTVVGQTPPGREWLLNEYFVGSLKDLDSKRRGPNTLVRQPLVRFDDPAAERSFRRAIRTIGTSQPPSSPPQS